jgi:hypothetical protein
MDDFLFDHRCAECGHDIDDHAQGGFYPCDQEGCDCHAFIENTEGFTLTSTVDFSIDPDLAAWQSP